MYIKPDVSYLSAGDLEALANQLLDRYSAEIEQLERATAVGLYIERAIDKSAASYTKQLLQHKVAELLAFGPRWWIVAGRNTERFLVVLDPQTGLFVRITEVVVAHLVDTLRSAVKVRTGRWEFRGTRWSRSL